MFYEQKEKLFENKHYYYMKDKNTNLVDTIHVLLTLRKFSLNIQHTICNKLHNTRTCNKINQCQTIEE